MRAKRAPSRASEASPVAYVRVDVDELGILIVRYIMGHVVTYVRIRPYTYVSGKTTWGFSTWGGTFLLNLAKMYLSKLPLPFPLPLALFFSLFIFLGACPPPRKNKQ